jgi:hypothetical protein
MTPRASKTPLIFWECASFRANSAPPAMGPPAENRFGGPISLILCFFR